MIEAVRSLRGFMENVLILDEAQRQAPQLIYTLHCFTRLANWQINECLDKLDFRFVKVKWNGRGQAISLEVLRRDVENISDEPLFAAKKTSRDNQKTATPKTAGPSRIRECVTCRQIKKIYSYDKCWDCWYQDGGKELSKNYHKKLYDNLLVGKCGDCGEEKKIFPSGKCGNCRQKNRISRLPQQPCSLCGKERPVVKVVNGDHVCLSCRASKFKKSGVCTSCQQEKKIFAKGKCQQCYTKSRKQKSENAPNSANQSP